jgi:hypothetical protein
VVFVDKKTISPADIGGLVWTLTNWQEKPDIGLDWSNRFPAALMPNCFDVTAKTNLAGFRRWGETFQRNAGREHRTITQVCEMLLHEGVEAYKREGPKFMQRLVAKQKARVKDPWSGRKESLSITSTAGLEERVVSLQHPIKKA